MQVLLKARIASIVLLGGNRYYVLEAFIFYILPRQLPTLRICIKQKRFYGFKVLGNIIVSIITRYIYSLNNVTLSSVSMQPLDNIKSDIAVIGHHFSFIQRGQ